jgi:hypothetical protein
LSLFPPKSFCPFCSGCLRVVFRLGQRINALSLDAAVMIYFPERNATHLVYVVCLQDYNRKVSRH